MKGIFRFIFSRLFLLNLLLAVVIIVSIVFGITKFLDKYTMHNQSCVVPNLIGLQEREVEDLLSQQNLKYVISDSVFSEKVNLGAIAEQSPEAGFSVKSGRTIYLVKNAELPEMISIPRIVDLSLRRAKSKLEAYGFVLGKLEYIPDIGTNVVLKIKHNGDLVESGEQLLKGATIDLVLGQGLSDDKTSVPNVEGLAIDAATTKLNERFLNIGAVIYADDVKNDEDSLNAKIYKQYPTFDTVRNVNLGYSVDLWFTTDTLLIPEYLPDSVMVDSMKNQLIELIENTEDDDN